MYSGLSISNYSGNVIGTHQKFDKMAYRHLKNILAEKGNSHFFPNLSLILHFEGKNSPDGLKLKSPGRDEPHHFYNPHQPEQTHLLEYLEDHSQQLTKALINKDKERSAWEAAWLAHTIVDGLTPAHHYPYEQESYNLRGETLGEQKKVLDKVLIKRKQLSGHWDSKSKPSWSSFINKNWSLWMGKGLIFNHATFEFGVALIVKPLNLENARPSLQDMERYKNLGLVETFKNFSLLIADYEMYRSFYNWGWTPKLALHIKNFLAPLTVKLITLSWWESVCAAQAKTLKDRSSKARPQSKTLI